MPQVQRVVAGHVILLLAGLPLARVAASKPVGLGDGFTLRDRQILGS